MRQYKIYNRVKTDPSRRTDASFGCNEWMTQKMLVGTSKLNSFEAGTLEIDHVEKDNLHIYRASFNGICLFHITFDSKSKKFDVNYKIEKKPK